MRFRYLLFDLDGTLTDPKEGITTSVQYALHGIGIEEPDREKLTSFIGPPLKESFMEFYHLKEEQAEKAVEIYREWFAPKGMYQNRIYVGIAEMLCRLKAAGKVLAVASSKPEVFVKKILKYFGVYELFDVIVGSGLDGTGTGKEEVVEKTLERLFSEKTDDAKKKALLQTVMIGDRKFDVAGGKRHGLYTAGCAYGYAGKGELEEAGADDIVHTVPELERLLMQ